MKLKIKNKEFEIKWEKSELAKNIAKNFPFNKKLDWRYWDELYVLTDFWLQLDENTKEIFEIWDIVYWVKNDNSKEAIAIFFGNTPAWDWTKPRPVSKCNLIWRITWDISIDDKIWKWDEIKIKV